MWLSVLLLPHWLTSFCEIVGVLCAVAAIFVCLLERRLSTFAMTMVAVPFRGGTASVANSAAAAICKHVCHDPWYDQAIALLMSRRHASPVEHNLACRMCASSECQLVMFVRCTSVC